jgi:mannose-1-phosphate guanylyltransferase
MNIVVFAGGTGRRFWPLSRRNFPKQFQPIFNNKSTIELMLERVSNMYGWDHIFVPTTEHLVSLVKHTFPSLSTSHILPEPERKGLGAAVGLAMIRLKKRGSGKNPVAILWSDNFPGDEDRFLKALAHGRNLVENNPDQIVFLGENPHSADHKLGWIKLGKQIENKDSISTYMLDSFKYRPSKDQAAEWADNPHFVWNTGYFISTPEFILSQYRAQQPKLYKHLKQIETALGTSDEEAVITKEFLELEHSTFDASVLEGIGPEKARILKTEFNWIDPSTIYALKQYLQETEEDTITKGLVYSYETKDSLVYNYVKNQVVSTIGLEGFVVVNTPDALLICSKEKIHAIKHMLEEWEGTELEKFL